MWWKWHKAWQLWSASKWPEGDRGKDFPLLASVIWSYFRDPSKREIQSSGLFSSHYHFVLNFSLPFLFTQSQLNLRGRGSFHPSISFLYSQPHLFLISNFQAGLVIYFPTFQSPLPELSLRFSFLSTSFDVSLFHSMLNSGSFRANLIYPSICRSGSLDLPSTHFLCFT